MGLTHISDTHFDNGVTVGLYAGDGLRTYSPVAGIGYILIEREAEYVEIAQGRVNDKL